MKNKFLSLIAAGLMLGGVSQIKAMDPQTVLLTVATGAAIRWSNYKEQLKKATERNQEVDTFRQMEWNEIHRQYGKETPTFKVYQDGNYSAQAVYYPDPEKQIFKIIITDSINNNEKNKSEYTVDPRKACNGQHGAYLTTQLNQHLIEHAKKVAQQS
jgi:hypothetical protein